MCGSNLASAFIPSPNLTIGRDADVTRITPHYMAGNMTAESCAKMFADGKRKASAHYCIGSDGGIVQCVHERNTPWTSSSHYNDTRAITIECANLPDGSLTLECWTSLVNLCVDICKRYSFRLNYTGDTTGNLTMHKWFADTSCPGPWLSHKFDALAITVNNLLDNGDEIMNCFLRLNGDKNTPLYYFDGTSLHKLTHNDERVAIDMVAEKTLGHKLPMFELGSKTSPYGTRFAQAITRGF